MAEPSTPATIEEVAAAAGVSRSTVSRVVNGSPSVSAAAEERVRAAIAQLKYVPNQLARSLASRQTKAIALVVPEDVSRFFGDPFIAAVVADVHRRLTESDYVLTMVLAGENTAERTIAYLRGGSVDGVIVVSHHSRDAFVDRIADVVPVVFGGRPTHKRADAADYYVDADNVEGGRLATAHLIERGHRRIATIAGPADMPAGIDRLSGYRQALTDAGLAEGTVAFGDFSERGGEAAMREILAAGTPDAVFAASDLMAKGAVTVLHEAGLRIPQDVAVIGFDDAPVAAQMTPKLTTIRQPVFGDLVAQRLIELLAGERPPRASFVELELVVRDSV
ncbi:LacI family DNA-binding transcriptional regulator [Microbacterium gorillae]|uniref:LacI family DNA-binding transcriptional regulator n=1 Tax=Microbacterium gorillae TaxID=1231063 RepID=UPI003D9514E9